MSVKVRKLSQELGSTTNNMEDFGKVLLRFTVLMEKGSTLSGEANCNVLTETMSFYQDLKTR